MGTGRSGAQEWLDAVLAGWFVLALLSTMYVVSHAFTKNRDLAVTRWGWVLATLYTGPIGAILYALSSGTERPASPEMHVKPRWKQALGSTIHCVAGDATGIIVVAAFAGALGLPMWLDLVVEYVLGFGFGLFIFQALSLKGSGVSSYAAALRRSFLPAWVSMNAMMAGMIPTMVLLMSRDPAAMHPGSAHFWGVMSLATLVGAVATYPLNWWLVAAGALHDAPIAARRRQMAAMSVVSLLALASGVLLAGAYAEPGTGTESHVSTASLRVWRRSTAGHRSPR